MDNFGKRLSWARSNAGFKNATEAARRFGWNENTYRSHENGTREPKRELAQIYARAFKVNFNWLFLGEGLAPEMDRNEKNDMWEAFMEADEAVQMAVRALLRRDKEE